MKRKKIQNVPAHNQTHRKTLTRSFIFQRLSRPFLIPKNDPKTIPKSIENSSKKRIRRKITEKALLAASWPSLGPSRGRSGTSLALPWGVPGRSLEPLGRSWGALVEVLLRFGALLGVSGVPKGAPGGSQGLPQIHSGTIFRTFSVTYDI